MKDHDVKKFAQKFSKFRRHARVQLDVLIALPPYLLEPQISRHFDHGCFIGHQLAQNNTMCCKRMPEYSSGINDYANITEQVINTNQLNLKCCSTKYCNG